MAAVNVVEVEMNHWAAQLTTAGHQVDGIMVETNHWGFCVHKINLTFQVFVLEYLCQKCHFRVEFVFAVYPTSVELPVWYTIRVTIHFSVCSVLLKGRVCCLNAYAYKSTILPGDIFIVPYLHKCFALFMCICEKPWLWISLCTFLHGSSMKLSAGRWANPEGIKKR